MFFLSNGIIVNGGSISRGVAIGIKKNSRINLGEGRFVAQEMLQKLILSLKVMNLLFLEYRDRPTLTIRDSSGLFSMKVGPHPKSTKFLLGILMYLSILHAIPTVWWTQAETGKGKNLRKNA